MSKLKYHTLTHPCGVIAVSVMCKILKVSVTKSNKALTSLLDAINQHMEKEPMPSNAAKLVMYFDEAHVLTTKPAGKTLRTLYNALCSALSHFYQQSLFVIFLSATSQLYGFAPPTKGIRLAHALSASASIQAPITEVPFDCFLGFLICQNELKLAQLSDIGFMAWFGRPL